MDLTQLSADLLKLKKQTDAVLRLVKTISRLEQGRMQHLPQLKKHLAKLRETLVRLAPGADPYGPLRSWTAHYGQEIQRSEAQLKNRFGVELAQELQKIGLPLSGQYPELRSGFFTIEIDFEKHRATLWYGPGQERLGFCPLSTADVADRISTARQQLGSQLSEDEFLSKLHRAYARAADDGKPVPIVKVMSELAYLLQSQAFLQDPRKENYRGYSRADFSFDLFRMHRQQQRNLFDLALHLTVATRTHTRRRQDFLWIPDDESGKGTTYSYLQFREATP